MNTEDQAEYIIAIFQSGVEQGLELAAQVVDTACSADESLHKLAEAIRGLKSD